MKGIVPTSTGHFFIWNLRFFFYLVPCFASRCVYLTFNLGSFSTYQSINLSVRQLIKWSNHKLIFQSMIHLVSIWSSFLFSIFRVRVRLSKHDGADNENIIWKCNFPFLQSFLNYSKSSRLQNVFQLSWNQIGTSAWEMNRRSWAFIIICSRRPHNWKTGHLKLWKEQARLRKKKTKNARAKRKKLLFLIVKYANPLWHIVFVCLVNVTYILTEFKSGSDWDVSSNRVSLMIYRRRNTLSWTR